MHTEVTLWLRVAIEWERAFLNSFPKERNTNEALAIKHSSSSDFFNVHNFTLGAEICTALIITFYSFLMKQTNLFSCFVTSIWNQTQCCFTGKTQIKYFLLTTKRRERFLENEIIGNLREKFSLEFWGKPSKYKNQNTIRSLEQFSVYPKAKTSIDQKAIQIFQFADFRELVPYLRLILKINLLIFAQLSVGGKTEQIFKWRE